jgi:CheY-like chemotaxis protein
LMADSRQHVLIVGAKDAGLKRVAPMLRRAEFSVHSVDPSPFLLDLVLSTAFELVIVRYPMDTVPLDDLVDTIRNEGSACHGAGLLLLAEPELIDDAQRHVDLGANRAICTDWSDARLLQSIGDLLEIAPRIFMRVLMHAEIEVQSTADRAIFQTVNVSVTGALLQGSDQLDPGQAFDFLFRLPGGGLVEGSAEVVRQTNPLREGVDGMGARFISFGDGCEDRLVTHVQRQIDLGNNR